MRLSPTSTRVLKFSSYVNQDAFSLKTLDNYVSNLEAKVGKPSYGLNYVRLKSGLVRITLIFKEEASL